MSEFSELSAKISKYLYGTTASETNETNRQKQVRLLVESINALNKADTLLANERNAREAVEAKVARLREFVRKEHIELGCSPGCCKTERAYAHILAETAEPASEKEV